MPNNARNITIVSVPTIPLFDYSGLLRKVNDSLIVHWIRSSIRKYGLDNAALIIYNPRFSCVIGQLEESLICYDVIDDKLEFEATPKWLEPNHQYLIRKSNIIITSAESLYKKITRERNSVFLIGNGADVSHFKKALNNIEIPPDVCCIKNPILGYIGAIGEWIDFALLEKVLQKYPGVSVVMIGWVFNKQRKAIRSLSKNYNNFHFLRRRSYDVLPNYVKAFKACIIPFRIYELTKSVNPTKLYEYLAAGKPIICTALPELEKYKNVIYLARDQDEFVELVNKALTSKHDVSKFLQIAEEHDWKIKVKEMVNLIVSHSKPPRN